MKTRPIPAPPNWKDIKPHPLAALCPYGQGINTADLAEHMRINGYDGTEPIVLWQQPDGTFLILDGRHRHVAAQEADVVPSFVVFIGGDPIPFVMKKLKRQHLNESQRAMFGAKLLEIATSKVDLANLPTTQEQAASVMNVSPRLMQDAVTVNKQGGGPVKQQVASGQTSVSTAAAIVRTERCERCERCGPQKNCKKCQELQAKASIASLRKNKPKPPKKIGAEKFDWKAFDNHFGFVARGPDELKKAYPKQLSSFDYDDCVDLLTKFARAWKKARTSVTGSKD